MSFQVSRGAVTSLRVGMATHCSEGARRVSWNRRGLPLYRDILVLANRYSHPEVPLGAHCPDFSRGVSARQFSPVGVRSSLHFPAAQRLIFHAVALMQDLGRARLRMAVCSLDCYAECRRVAGKARRIRGSRMVLWNDSP